MKKTIKHYSKKLDNKTFNELSLIAFRYTKVKNHFYQKYGSISGLLWIDKPRDIRNMYVKNNPTDWGLSARYWKQALSEAIANIKTIWVQTKDNIKSNLRGRNLSKQELHYCNYLLKSNKLLYEVLNYNQPKLDVKYESKFTKVDKIYFNKLIRRMVRKYHHKAISKRARSFMIDSNMYKIEDDLIKITSLTKNKRLSIKLTEPLKRVSSLRIVLDKNKQRIEIHSTKDVKTQINNNSIVVGIDKGYKDAFVTSNGGFYGKGLSKLLIKLSDKLNQKNKQRNRIRSKLLKYIDKLKDENNTRDDKEKYQRKVSNIIAHNLGKKKYNRYYDKAHEEIKSFINSAIKELLNKEKPKIIIVESLKFQKKHEVKKVNRRLNSWLKGYMQERLSYKLSVNQTELAEINPAYTSQVCCHCGHFGNRNGSRFYCPNCDKVVNADYNASINILNRYYDSDITLYTHFKKVESILLSRIGDACGVKAQKLKQNGTG